MSRLPDGLLTNPLAIELATALEAAQEAAGIVMALRATAASSFKRDGSIVTEADLASDAAIRARICGQFSEDAVLSEEASGDASRLDNSRCWIIDPIDGTRQYADGSDEFDIYIALSVAGRIVLGVAIQPATGTTICAVQGEGAHIWTDGDWSSLKQARSADRAVIGTRPWLGWPENRGALVAVAEVLGGRLRDPRASISIRSFLPGPDSLDVAVALYPPGREPESYEWDLAVLDIVLREAGGAAMNLDGSPLVFNKADPRFPGGLILSRSREIAEPLRVALTS